MSAKEINKLNFITNICQEVSGLTDTIWTDINYGDIFPIEFSMIGGSDSVKLVWDIDQYLKDHWKVEIYPIDNTNAIATYDFSSKDDAVKAFNVFRAYYRLVVEENFKMF